MFFRAKLLLMGLALFLLPIDGMPGSSGPAEASFHRVGGAQPPMFR